MRFQVVKTAAGWAVQNTQTYTIAGLFSTRTKAENVAEILNRK